MELAIPLVGLFGLYVISNKKQKKEPFISKPESQLPNVDIPDKNFPNDPTNNSTADLTSKLSTSNAYDGQSTYTDKFFNKNTNYVNTLPGYSADNKFVSLTGATVGYDYFTHNNMVPFFGSKSHANNDANAYESLLDNYTGQGSQTISKKEVAPMFAASQNMQWATGMPSATDFIQSRVNPSMNMAGVRPFEQIQVGPGLGLGESTAGVGGYNSGTLAREMWIDKTANDMRVLTKQKASGLSMLGFEGGPHSHVKERGALGAVERYGVDGSFEMGRDRLFTTVGASTAATLRPDLIAKDVYRPTTETEHIGNAGATTSAQYLTGEYAASTNIELGQVPVQCAYAPGKSGAYESDYGHKSTMAYNNNRSSNYDHTHYGVLGSTVSAVISPLLDILRPSRRENMVGNLRPYQNLKTPVSNSYVYDPTDRPQPTIRDTVDNTKQFLQVNNITSSIGAYSILRPELTPQQRITTETSYMGNSSAPANAREMRSITADYNQRNNIIKSATIEGRMVPGSMSLLGNSMNVHSKAKDAYLVNNREISASTMAGTSSPAINTFGITGGRHQALYEGMQYDRNNGEILKQLQDNPYALNINR